MEQEIKEVMAAVFKCDISEINDDTSPDNLEQWDSLGHMNLIVALEEEFNFTFQEDEIIDMLNYKLIRITVESKLSKTV